MDDIKLRDYIQKNSLQHIAIIMDGNGRWAKQKGLQRSDGHIEGVNRVVDLVEACYELEIKVLSLYAFSTENWKRPENEVSTLFKLLIKFVNKELARLMKYNVKLQIMGDISKLPFATKIAVEKALQMTKDNTGLIVNIGINYGSRLELMNAVKCIVDEVLNERISKDDIDENTIEKYLYTNNLPDPDLLIRTGGEQRLSNFMLYQLAYSEFYFTDILFPDFGKEEFKESILKYFNRDRRFGGINE